MEISTARDDTEKPGSDQPKYRPTGPVIRRTAFLDHGRLRGPANTTGRVLATRTCLGQAGRARGGRYRAGRAGGRSRPRMRGPPQPRGHPAGQRRSPLVSRICSLAKASGSHRRNGRNVSFVWAALRCEHERRERTGGLRVPVRHGVRRPGGGRGGQRRGEPRTCSVRPLPGSLAGCGGGLSCDCFQSVEKFRRWASSLWDRIGDPGRR